ncbi:type II secretion system protein G precursor [Moorella thermoacetica]|uniref:Type II secretion system protein G n=1 Tax=Neomoorella thermoacetica TaxID=1525 RepID=A0A1J5JFR8_NEOTH|nr:prepilin-type N-terminal cleavage/methylation domain-containing protein [Moorella thermoacetica]OIQ07676.1 type II secretion system protein G precursor [Moorella thermoacetica]
MRLRQALRNKKGFTLIELLVVITIMGILIAIALPRFLSQADKARIASAKATLAAMKTSIEAYRGDPANNDNYPTDIGTVLKNDGFAAGTKDPWGNEYKYIVDNSSTPKTYTLYSMGPNGAEGGNDDIYIDQDTAPTSGASKSGGSDVTISQ